MGVPLHYSDLVSGFYPRPDQRIGHFFDSFMGLLVAVRRPHPLPNTGKAPDLFLKACADFRWGSQFFTKSFDYRLYPLICRKFSDNAVFQTVPRKKHCSHCSLKVKREKQIDIVHRHVVLDCTVLRTPSCFNPTIIC